VHISHQRLPENPALEITPEVLLKRPALLPFFGPIIAIWADIEGRLDALFHLMIDDPACLAEFSMLKGWDRRAKCFVQAVRARHGEPSANQVKAILGSVSRPAKKRNDVAHGIWGIEASLPEALIIFSSQLYTASAVEALHAQSHGSPKLVLDKDRLFDSARVVTAEHLDKLIGELRDAYGAAIWMRSFRQSG
jgi:hypothetical protein